jgi:NADP-dependent 3-hydroxy acid dehydrogenase YdfG
VIAALPLMKANRNGLFIHIGSRAGRFWDGPSGGGYIAAKSALIAMSHSNNREECLNGIRSTIINPGETATEILKNREANPVTADELERILKPEDCGDLIRYAPARNDDMVVSLVERFGQGAANSGVTTSDQDSILGHLHGTVHCGLAMLYVLSKRSD